MFGYFQRVIDLGVMTPCEKILQTAMEENAGIKNLRFSFEFSFLKSSYDKKGYAMCVH